MTTYKKMKAKKFRILTVDGRLVVGWAPDLQKAIVVQEWSEFKYGMKMKIESLEKAEA